ncbi:MAG: hypothetical protein WC465_03110 [Patescibacteria group bacterium]
MSRNKRIALAIICVSGAIIASVGAYIGLTTKHFVPALVICVTGAAVTIVSMVIMRNTDRRRWES